MSPKAKPPVADAKLPARRANAGKDSTGDVRVDMAGDRIRVTWVTSCAVREFRPADLRTVLEHMDTLGALGGEDVWLESEDSDGRYFALLVMGARAYATDGVRDPEGIDNVSWTLLKRALTARARMGGPEQE